MYDSNVTYMSMVIIIYYTLCIYIHIFQVTFDPQVASEIFFTRFSSNM